MVWQPKTKARRPQVGYQPSYSRVRHKVGVPVRAKVKMDKVLLETYDYNQVKKLLKLNKKFRERGWKMVVYGDPDNPNYKGKYIVRLKPMDGPDNGITVQSLKIG